MTISGIIVSIVLGAILGWIRVIIEKRKYDNYMKLVQETIISFNNINDDDIDKLVEILKKSSKR